MAEILSKGHEKAAMMKELILQPQSELRYFREFLRQSGFVIVKENMIKEDGKFYPIIKAVYGGSNRKVVSADSLSGGTLQRIADSFGPCLLADRHPVLKEYLEMLRERDEKILESLKSAGKQAVRREELCGELSDIAYCLTLYEA